MESITYGLDALSRLPDKDGADPRLNLAYLLARLYFPNGAANRSVTGDVPHLAKKCSRDWPALSDLFQPASFRINSRTIRSEGGPFREHEIDGWGKMINKNLLGIRFRDFAFASLIITFTFSLLLSLLSVSPVVAGATQLPDYKLDKKVTLGGDGGWDYFDVDPGNGHIFIPRGTHVLVVDAKGKQLADIGGAKGAHAIVFAPDLDEAFLSTNGSVSIVDMATLKIRAEIQLNNRDPDAIVYDSSVKRVFTFNGGGTNDATAIDAVSGKVLGNIPLNGNPESAQADGQGHIFVNIEDQNKIAAFDSSTLKILDSWPVSPCENPAGLAIDVAHRRLFTGCRNGLMAVVDYGNGKIVATLPIGKGVDTNRFDPQTGLVFASCGEGVITVAHEDSPDKYSLVQTIHTEKGARTMALDLASHNVYTVTAQFGPPPAPTPEHPHPYPSIIPRTFTMLIFTQ